MEVGGSKKLSPMSHLSIGLLTVGKPKGTFDFLRTGEALYQKRLAAYCDFTWQVVPEEKITVGKPDDVIKAAEAERLLRAIPEGMTVVALSEEGQLWESRMVARWLAQLQGWTVPPHLAETPVSSKSHLWMDGRQSPPDRGMGSWPAGPIMMVVGGPLGLAQSVRQRAHGVWSLSPLTFPHPVVPLLVLEQLYRGFTLLHQHPYHK